MTKVQFFYRMLYGMLLGLFFALTWYAPLWQAKVFFIACGLGALYLYVRAIVVYLPQQRNKLKYFALHAESKQIVFKPVASGLYRVAMVTFTYKHTPEHAFTISEAGQGQTGLKWDKTTIGALREHTGRNVMTFGDLTPKQAYRLFKRLVKDDKSGTHIFEAIYLNKQIKQVQSTWLNVVTGRLSELLNPSPPLPIGGQMGENTANITMAFALFTIQLPDALNAVIVTVWLLNKLLRYIRATAERQNNLNNSDAVCAIVRAMLRAEAAGNMVEADRLNDRLNRLK